jgi:C-terminal processing protease CtpA/Prc
MKTLKQNTSIPLIIVCLLIAPTFLFGQNDSVQLFEPSLIKEDIDTLISSLKTVHPTFLNSYQQKLIDSIKNRINKPLSSLDLFRIMQPTVCIDGHTTLAYTGEVFPKMDNPYFPFKVIIYNNNLYVKENLSDVRPISKGAVVEKINGTPANEIINNLARYLPGEKESYKIKSLEYQFHIFYRLVYGPHNEFNVTIENADLKLRGAQWSVFQEASRPKFELRFYDDDIAYIYKRSFKPAKDFISFMDSAFTVISGKQIKYLIIDNLQGGGMSDLADSLMTYFTEKPYRLVEKKMTKISSLTEDFIEAKKSEGYVKDNFFIQDFPVHRSTRSNRFSGSTYILVGPLSYSAGTCFPAAAKCYGTATIIGEETGQPLVSNGDLTKFTLKNSKLTCFTSLSRIYMPCNNNDDTKGLLPDYYVTPSLDDLLNDKDYTLDYALKMIREIKKKK